MGLFKWLRSKVSTEKASESHVQSPYADFRRVTKTGKVRAKGGTRNKKEWFGIDEGIYTLPNLSDKAKGVYVYLSRIADNDGYCFPFHKTIATRCSISESAVRKAITELEANGLLTKVVRRVSRRGGSSNIYQLHKVEITKV